jgi:hypothetical protein
MGFLTRQISVERPYAEPQPDGAKIAAMMRSAETGPSAASHSVSMIFRASGLQTLAIARNRSSSFGFVGR